MLPSNDNKIHLNAPVKFTQSSKMHQIMWMVVSRVSKSKYLASHANKRGKGSLSSAGLQQLLFIISVFWKKKIKSVQTNVDNTQRGKVKELSAGMNHCVLTGFHKQMHWSTTSLLQAHMKVQSTYLSKHILRWVCVCVCVHILNANNTSLKPDLCPLPPARPPPVQAIPFMEGNQFGGEQKSISVQRERDASVQ